MTRKGIEVTRSKMMGPIENRRLQRKTDSSHHCSKGWRVLSLGVALMLFVASHLVAGTDPSIHTVCPSGCDFSTIAAGIANSNPGDIVEVQVVGTHTEGPIQVFKNITIEGLGESTTVVQQAPTLAQADRSVFVVWLDATVTIRDMTLRHGRDDLGGCIAVLSGELTLDHVTVRNCDGDTGGAILNRGRLTLLHSTVLQSSATEGGGIYNELDADLSLIRSVVQSNESTSSGGGLFNRGLTYVSHSWFLQNQGGDSGGAITSDYTGQMELQSSHVAMNSVSTSFGTGGGIFNHGELTVRDSSVSDNSAAGGGGFFLMTDEPASISGTTFSGNTAQTGAGLYVLSPLDLVNSTVSGNQASDDGGGIYHDLHLLRLANVTLTENTADSDHDDSGNGGGIFTSGGEARLLNSLIAGNIDGSGIFEVRGPDCYGDLASDGYNLIGSLGRLGPINDPVCHITGATTGNTIGLEPELGPLAANGGPTLTHALQQGSPAINTGDFAGCLAHDGSLLDRDQRGYPRPDRCDKGAFEHGAATPDLIFEDGFESENTWAWSSEEP